MSVKFGRTRHSSPAKMPTSIWCTASSAAPVLMRELRGASAERADHRRRIAELLEEQRPPVAFDGSDGRQLRLAVRARHRPVLRIQDRRQRAAAKRESPVEVLRRNAVIRLTAQPHTESPRVPAFQHRAVILQFVTILRVERAPQRCAAAVERLQHQNRGTQRVGERLRRTAVKLEARLVDKRADQHRVRRLHCLVGELRMVAARNQVEAADPVVAHVRVRNAVAEHQRMVRTELIIHSRADVGEPARRGEDAGERLCRQRLGIDA